ncbi:MAG: serine/threonine protein kinase [Polyangiaceae bacterium]|jgi:serine/threonine protein kinase|nr:serine/threonine protein kinase [Polyangiaceae bacterium]MBK8943332.1 serine/threonine protein kinase [Polyangiaceae bacterium]
MPPTRRGTLHHDTKQTRPAMPRVLAGVLPLSNAPPGPQLEPAILEGPLDVALGLGSPGGFTRTLSRRPPVSRGVELNRLSELLVGETVMGRYRIEAQLGRGTTGIVFRAWDLQREAKVALKFLDPELASEPAVVERFRHEAIAPSRIGTEHVVEVLEADTCPELVPLVRPDDPLSPAVPYLVMELLVGSDLRSYLHQRGPLTPAEVTGFLGQIAPTLDRAHALGIVHRDLKPANLFLTRRADGAPLVKVLDFGVAQLSDASAARGLGGGLFGTPWYMAPEQAEGRVATPASDRWAMALVAFRLLTGESYWAPQPIPELLGQILLGPRSTPSRVVAERALHPLATLGPAFDAWFMHACRVDPSLRFGTMTEQIDALHAALEGAGG